MNDNVQKFVIFLIGFGLGVLATRKYLDNKYEAIIQEEIASVREVAATRSGRRNKSAEGDCDVDNAYSDTKDLDSSEFHSEDLHEYEKLTREANYAGHPGPYPISIEEFSEEMSNFDKLTIHYYAGDDTLVDEDEEIIADIKSTIGIEVHKDLNNPVGPSVAYVRNEQISVDYEVICIDKSFSEIAMS